MTLLPGLFAAFAKAAKPCRFCRCILLDASPETCRTDTLFWTWESLLAKNINITSPVWTSCFWHMARIYAVSQNKLFLWTWSEVIQNSRHFERRFLYTSKKNKTKQMRSSVVLNTASPLLWFLKHKKKKHDCLNFVCLWSPEFRLILQVPNLNTCISSHYKIHEFSYFWGGNRNWNFMWLTSLDDAYEIAIPAFPSKQEKNIINMSSANIDQQNWEKSNIPHLLTPKTLARLCGLIYRWPRILLFIVP